MEAPACPYCGRAAIQTTGREVYPYRQDLYEKKFWVCRRCDARVGCHPSGKPLGQLANKKLRQLRMNAHAAFDPLWKRGGYSRHSAYRWLSEALGQKSVHIGQSDEDTCVRIIEVCHSNVNRPKR